MIQSSPPVNFELTLNLVKQLSWRDQFRLLEWIMQQFKSQFALPQSEPERQAKFGSGKGTIIMADDFDAPLEDFVEYMP